MRRLLVELSVLATLLASFLTVPLPLPHVATGTAWVALTAVHVARHRRTYAALLRTAGSSARSGRRRVAATTALIGCAVTATMSGFAQWAGFSAAIPWHAGSSTVLIVLAAAHAGRRLWRMRRHHDAANNHHRRAQASMCT